MQQAIQLFKESLPTTTASSSLVPVKIVTVSAGNWGAITVYSGDKFLEPTAQAAVISGTPIAKRIALLEKDAKKRAALARARSRLGNVISAEGLTLTSLRLKKGMSQAALADAIGSKQSYVARIEKNRVDLRSSTIDKLAAILGVDRAVIMSALETGWKLNGEKEK